MALSFPNNPTVNQEYSEGTRTWKWDGSKWNLINSGIKGADGTDGTDGKSAYELAVENGFSGTEQEYVDSLPGTDGREVEFREDAGILEYRYVGSTTWITAFDIAEFLETDPYPPYIPNKTLAPSVTDSTYTVDFGKASDTATPQVGLNYFLVEGDPADLQDVDLIQDLQEVASGPDVSQLSAGGGPGELKNINVYVKDQAGNVSLYQYEVIIILDPQILSISATPTSIAGSLGDTGTINWTVNTNGETSGNQDLATPSSLDSSIITLSNINKSNGTADYEIVGGGFTQVQIVSDFDGTKASIGVEANELQEVQESESGTTTFDVV